MEFESIVLNRRDKPENERTRKILKGTGVKNSREASECLAIRLVYQKKHNKGMVTEGEEWRGLARMKLTDVPAGSEIQIDLDTAQTAQLMGHMQNLYGIASGGISKGITEKTVVASGDAQLLADLQPYVGKSADNRETILRIIREVDPEQLYRAAVAQRHERHVESLKEFEYHLAKTDWEERDWEKFFDQNKWIFGQGLSYQILTGVNSQPHYGGMAVSGKGDQKGDHLMATAAAVRFTVLVEVKTPQADLVLAEPYRNGVHLLGRDVTGGVNQLLANRRTWTVEGSRTDANRELEGESIFTIQPDGILVIGSTTSLNSRDKRTTFELFRQELHHPKIVTFDELFERASYLVNHELEYAKPGG